MNIEIGIKGFFTPQFKMADCLGNRDTTKTKCSQVRLTARGIIFQLK